jgi:glycosyltransferase involved in cell wall biosynthesis
MAKHDRGSLPFEGCARSHRPLALQAALCRRGSRQVAAHSRGLFRCHIDYLHAPLVRDFVDRTVTTHHGRLDLPDIAPFYSVFCELPLVAISEDQRSYLRQANWIGTVHHGLPRDLLPLEAKPRSGYLAFLGRISPEKAPDRAIQIAAKAGMPLKIAAKVDRVDEAYWNEHVRPMVKAHPNVEFIGEINEQDKARFLGEAAALLFPVNWPEPFGLVMIEAMACGTPTIAFRRGSVSEILEEGTSGFIVDTMEQAAMAVQRIPNLDRTKVRASFERRFTVERMAHDYLKIYRELTAVAALRCVGAPAASIKSSSYRRTSLLWPTCPPRSSHRAPCHRPRPRKLRRRP